jgi:hypothetical protein
MACASGDTRVTDSPRIVHSPLPWYSPQLYIGYFVIAVGVVFGIVVAWEGVSGGAILQGFMLGVLSAAVIAGLGLLYESSLRKRMNKRIGSEDEATFREIAFAPELRHITADFLESHRRIRQSARAAGAWAKFCDECQLLAIRRPHTIIDSKLAARLGAIDRPEYAVEPESILESGGATRSTLWLLSIAGALSTAYLLYRQNWFGGLMLIGVATFFAVTGSPALRDRFRIMRWDDGNVVARMGTLKDQDDRRWTVENAVMVIQTKETAGALFVRVVGKDGQLELNFADEHDPDFVKLWQRWNHPRPRIDLLLE